MNLLKIALLQIAPTDSLEGNLEKGTAACRQAKELGADIALFPEMWSNGYRIYDRPVEEWKAEAISAESEFVRAFGRLAGELGIEALLAVGPRSREHMVPAAKAAGCPDVRWFETRDEARDALVEMFAPGDAALLKASHFLNRFDLAADDLRRYPFP